MELNNNTLIEYPMNIDEWDDSLLQVCKVLCNQRDKSVGDWYIDLTFVWSLFYFFYKISAI